MTDEDQGPLICILHDIQTRLGRLEVRLSNLEMRMTAQEQHLVALVIGRPPGQDRIEGLVRRGERRPDSTDPR
jgi:hypothetical protein